MQDHPDLSREQRDQFRLKFFAIQEAYTTLEDTLTGIMSGLVRDQGTQNNVPWANPGLIVKIVRIMEFEAKFVQSLKKQGEARSGGPGDESNAQKV